MRRLNIIGCGRVGRTLARLWQSYGVFAIGDICDHTSEKSQAAVTFIGGGEPSAAIGAMRGADLWLLAPADDQIEACCLELSATAQLAAGNVVFHCSGALPSTVLAPATGHGAYVASVHPLKTFVDPAISITTFAGTNCAAEGDATALALLKPAFESIGANVFEIEPSAKTLYHAASVIVCNYLTALIEGGAKTYGHAGIKRANAMRIMEPLVRETIDNIFARGTAGALTGPIARGDGNVVGRQLGALAAVDANLVEVYRTLGLIAVDLAREGGAVDPAAFTALAALLRNPSA